MTGPVQLRRALVSDAATLAEFGARTFVETFAADNSPDDMATYLAQSFGAAIQRAELSSPSVAAFLAEVDGALVGYAVLRDGGDASGLPSLTAAAPVELQRLYVGRELKGRGVAQLLMAEVEAEARRRGGRTLWLGVWEKNARAIAFYEKSGFTDVGTHVFQLGSDAQTDRLMSKPLSP